MRSCSICLKIFCYPLFLVVFLIGSADLFAKDLDQAYVVQSPRFILYFGKNSSENTTNIVSKDQLAKYAFSVLDEVYEEYTELFDKAPTKKITLRFLSPSEFKKYTGAPAWTSAMYFNNEITIPLNHKKGVNLKDLGRAIKHEYAHAVIAEFSNGNCPAWLDEGIAQLLEGKINPLLGPALRKWISSNDAMPLPWLKNGFTLLNEEIVPAAYAQSLFASRILVKEHGYSAISKYLKYLDKGYSDTLAFQKAFNKKQSDFQADLTYEISQWARYGGFNP